jgi:hypothetical protein
MKKSEYMQLGAEFSRIFWRNINEFTEMIYWTPELDIFKFEEMLYSKGYDWNCSLKDFITEKYWTDAEDFVEYLLS